MIHTAYYDHIYSSPYSAPLHIHTPLCLLWTDWLLIITLSYSQQSPYYVLCFDHFSSCSFSVFPRHFPTPLLSPPLITCLSFTSSALTHSFNPVMPALCHPLTSPSSCTLIHHNLSCQPLFIPPLIQSTYRPLFPIPFHAFPPSIPLSYPTFYLQSLLLLSTSFLLFPSSVPDHDYAQTPS